MPHLTTSDEKHDRGGIHCDADLELTSLLEFSFKQKKRLVFVPWKTASRSASVTVDDVPMHTKEMRKKSLPHIQNQHAADHLPLLWMALIADGGRKDFWIPTPVRARIQRLVGLQYKRFACAMNHNESHVDAIGGDQRHRVLERIWCRWHPGIASWTQSWCGGSLFRWMTELGLGDGRVQFFSETVRIVNEIGLEGAR